MRAMGDGTAMTLSFRELQAQLQPGWGCEHSGKSGQFDVLVVPSLTCLLYTSPSPRDS